MTLYLEQSAHPRSGEDRYWDWEVRLAGPAEELAQVEKVEYRLHSTFPNRYRTITSASSRFRLKSYGWGEFMLYATVHFRSGETQSLEHWIRLSESAPAKSKEAEKPLKVFLSYTAGDSRKADAAKKGLMELGHEVLTTADNLQPGVPWRYALQEMISDVDLVVVLAPDHDSQAIEMEVAAARGLKRAVVPVVTADQAQQALPDQTRDVAPLKLKDESELGEALRHIDLSAY